jgi:hypothetical protein
MLMLCVHHMVFQSPLPAKVGLQAIGSSRLAATCTEACCDAAWCYEKQERGPPPHRQNEALERRMHGQTVAVLEARGMKWRRHGE